MYEPDSTTIKIPTGDEDIVYEVIKRVNNVYKTDFTVEATEDWDGVVFVFVKQNNCTLDDIFQLGCSYGAKVELLRMEKKIDF